MRFAKLLAAAFALGLSGQAEAAKIVTLTGSITRMPNGYGYVNFNPGLIGGISPFTWGLTIRFSQPVSGWVGILTNHTRTYFIGPDGNIIWGDDFGEDGVAFNLNNQTSAHGTSPYTTFRYPGGYSLVFNLGRPNGIINLDSMPAQVDYKASVFAAVPEPATWALLILGFGGIGAALRTQGRRTMRLVPAAA